MYHRTYMSWLLLMVDWRECVSELYVLQCVYKVCAFACASEWNVQDEGIGSAKKPESTEVMH